jgi:6-pyruvoyltetrahydropterin/6-carboxytetrahydropterin synthase
MMTYTVYREMFFSAAHHLRNYHGKCENLHGHNWKVRVYVSRDRLDANGFVLDFKDLSRILTDILEVLDHQDVNVIPPFDRLNPTAENLAAYLLNQAEQQVKAIDDSLTISKVMVWESDKSCAIVEV